MFIPDLVSSFSLVSILANSRLLQLEVCAPPVACSLPVSLVQLSSSASLLAISARPPVSVVEALLLRRLPDGILALAAVPRRKEGLMELWLLLPA